MASNGGRLDPVWDDMGRYVEWHCVYGTHRSEANAIYHDRTLGQLFMASKYVTADRSLKLIPGRWALKVRQSLLRYES